MKTCTNCIHKIKHSPDQINSIFICMRYPPKAQLITHQDKFGTQTASVNVYAVVNDQSPRCGEYQTEPKLLS